MNEQEPDTEELAREAALTRQQVAADVVALRSQLNAEALKDRALDVAERSAESLALRMVGRLARAPRAALDYARAHPTHALAIGSGIGLLTFAAIRRARR